MPFLSPAQLTRAVNPLLDRYLSKSVFDISNTVNRELFTVEGLMRYRNGQIGYEEMLSHGTNLVPVTLRVGLPAGTVISLDGDDESSRHDPNPIGQREDTLYQGSFLGASDDDYSGRSTSVGNRGNIKSDEYYMWRVSDSHKVRDICDTYHGNVYKGNEVPEQPHLRCRCTLTKLRNGESAPSGGGGITNTLGAISGGLTTADLLLRRMGLVENGIWNDIHRFVSGVNQVNSTLSNILDIADKLANPERLLEDVASKVMNNAKQQAVGHLKGKAQELILAQIKDPALQRTASLYMNGQLQAEAIAQLKGASPELAKAMDIYNMANGFTSKISNISKPSEALGVFEEFGTMAKTLGFGEEFARIAKPLAPLVENRAKIVLLETGIQAISRLGLLLL